MKMKQAWFPTRMTLSWLATLLAASACHGAEDAPFSGPQVGERLVPFKARAAVGEQAGKEFDLVGDANGRPLLLVFVHELTRPSAALTRIVVDYAKTRKEDDLQAGVVFLGDDLTELETTLRRAAHALPSDVPVGVSLDGGEGPGAYGLNRKMTLTVLVAKENRVTANFALVQPSVAADAPEIGHAIVQLLGGQKKPTLQEMGGERAAMMQRRPAGGGQDDGQFRALLAPVIRKTATPEDVAAAAKKVEDHAAKDNAFKHRVAEVAGRIIEAGRLDSYGTPAAQEYLRKWAQEFAAPKDENNEDEKSKQEGNDDSQSGSEDDDSE
jgi:hypothetical protein